MAGERISNALTQRDIQGTVVPNQLAVLRHLLEDRRTALTDDYQHSMQGNQRLKKDPVVNVINNQTNSPGAIQQVGIGENVSQQAFAQNHQELVNAIDRALASDEFAQLSPDIKEAFSDTALVVKEEAVKAQPDVGKLKRWGRRLVDCVPAWNKDPVFGVIGVQSGPPQ